MRRFLKKINFNTLSVILFLLISITTLFAYPIVGMADNGDYYRIISQNDLYHLSSNDEDIYFGYFNKDYGIFKYNNEVSKTLISTQSIIIKIAVFIDKVITKDYIFDIRVLACLYIVIQAFAMYFFTKVLIKDVNNEKYKLLIVLLLNFIFADTAYLAYYNSFYGEAVGMSCFLFSIGIMLYMCKYNKFNIHNIMLFGIFTFLLIGSKQQLSPIGIIVSLLMIRIIFLNKDIRIKIISSILAILFIFSSIYFYKSIKGDFDYINRYHSMTRGALLNEENTDDILEEFRIYDQYSILKNEIFFEDIPMINPYNERLLENFYNKYSFIDILEFYIKNPKALSKMSNLAFKNAYSIRPELIGNYEKSVGKPYGEKSYFFAFWSSFKKGVIPNSLGISLIYIFLFLLYIIKKYVNAIKGKNKNNLIFQDTLVYSLLIGLSQIVISIIGAGDADLAKHLFMYNLSFDLILLIIIGDCLKSHNKEGSEN